MVYRFDQSISIKCTLLLFFFFIYGCSAVGYVQTSDPHLKIEQAIELYRVEGRPIPADKLLAEAISIFENENNKTGLVRAYRARAYFFLSPSVERSSGFFKKHGFLLDGDVFESKEKMAISYLLKVREILIDDNRDLFSALTEVNMALAETYSVYFNDEIGACAHVLEAQGFYLKLRALDPYDNPAALSNYKSFNEFFTKLNAKYSCS